MFNGGIFKDDPVHDPAATRWLQAKPGERVRVYFVNAGPNEFSSFHPIAGIWDRVYLSGNPANVMHGMQSLTVGPGDAANFDLISPVEGDRKSDVSGKSVSVSVDLGGRRSIKKKRET